MKKTLKISEIKELLNNGKTVKVKTLNNEYTKIVSYIEKGNLKTYEVVLEDDFKIKTSSEHKFFSLSDGWIETRDIIPNETKILCEDEKYRFVKSVNFIGIYPIVDITVEHQEHCYFGNGILNHNSGKSYMAAQIATQAQKMGIHVIYFDSESAIDQEFIENIGIDLDKFTYVQAHSVEFVYRTIEEILSASDGVKYLFIWDSYANTSSESDLENDEFNPQSSMAKIPRISSLGMKKLTIPIANNQATLIVLNQLKTNLGDPNAMKMEPWFTPGGKALLYAYSLRIWLTARKTKDSFVINSNGYKIGSEIKAKLKKSRFGSEGRECSFKIIWGQEPIGIQDDESIFEAIKPFIEQNGAWYAVKIDESTVKKFQQKEWLELMKEEKFRNKIMEIMDYEVIEKFKNKTGDAKVFYDIDNEIKDFAEDEG